MDKIKLAEYLYKNRLPSIYRKEDEIQKPVSFPLKRFLQITDVGFDYIQDKMQGIYDMYDIDKCPPEFLDYLAGMVGFEFPYELSEQEKRAFLKALPVIYKNKGNKVLFKYLGRLMFGNETEVDVTRIPMGVDGKLYNTIELLVKVNGDVQDLDKRTNRYNQFAEKFRPVNHDLNVLISLLYYEAYDSQLISDYSAQDLVIYINDEETYDISKMVYSDTHKLFIPDEDTYDTTPTFEDSDLVKDNSDETYDIAIIEREEIAVISEKENETYDNTQMNDPTSQELLLNYESDEYNGISQDLVTDDSLESMKVTDTDSYDKSQQSDVSQDKVIDLGSYMSSTRRLATSRLGTTFMLGRTDKETVLAENLY